MPSPGPLTGITVLDLTRVLSGPFCTMMLADMGARVIKVERPGDGDETRAWGPPFVAGESAYFLGTNRNKESIALDFKRPEGRQIVERLLDRADVVVENFRPGTLTRLGLDYTSLKDARPKLIHASISGFGQTGPRRNEAGYDAVVQAEGGLMSITGDADGPPFRVGVAIADLVAGMLAAHGIVLALFVRERTGRGQQVDIGMLDGVISILSYHASMHLTAGIRSGRVGNRHATIAPYDTFTAADGDFFLAVGNDDQFRRFCAAAGIAALSADARFATNPSRVAHHAELRQRLAPILCERSRGYWIETLTSAGVPCGSVRGVPEALADPQILAREMVQSVEHATAGLLKVVGVPIKLSETPGSVRTAPPTFGQHTETILRELEIGDDEIDRLRGERVIGV
jgi:crotonobetainyl-CoA:carnitine CoA-transferase CaiB-like acyl-CoA transferase